MWPRLHTALAVAFVALVPLVPLGMRAYASAAGVDRGSQVAHAEALLGAAPPPAGARDLGRSVYAQPAWGNGESLVPVSSYTVETAYRLERPLRSARIVATYERELPGWRRELDGEGNATFRRGADTIALDFSEYRDGPGPLHEYGVIVSQ